MTYTHLLMALVDAIWVGPSGYTLVDGTMLETGVTLCTLSEDEALLSENWLVPLEEDPEQGKVTNDGDND